MSMAINSLLVAPYRIVGVLRREAARLTGELQVISHDMASSEREASDAMRQKEDELAAAREESSRFEQEAEKYKKAVAGAQSQVQWYPRF